MRQNSQKAPAANGGFLLFYKLKQHLVVPRIRLVSTTAFCLGQKQLFQLCRVVKFFPCVRTETQCQLMFQRVLPADNCFHISQQLPAEFVLVESQKASTLPHLIVGP